jgi:hypothetical protein
MTQPFSSERPIYPTTAFKEQRQLNTKKRRVITVFLSNEPTDGVEDWRCQKCGGIVFQYYNQIRGVFEGAINLEDCEKPTDHLCRKCNIIFRLT